MIKNYEFFINYFFDKIKFFICHGMLLSCLQMPEEEAFAVLVKVMQGFRMRELFKPTMAELGVCMFQLECLIQVAKQIQIKP